MLNKKMSAWLLICSAVLFCIAFLLLDDSNNQSITSSQVDIENPYKAQVEYANKFLLAANDTSGISLPPDMGKQQLKFILKAGTQAGELGIDSTHSRIGPGLLKRLRNGYLIADTFNNRILKLNEEGDIKQTLNFPSSSLIQGAAENSRGEISVITRLDKKLSLNRFDAAGNTLDTQPIDIKDEEFLFHVGTYRSFYNNDTLYINNGDKTLRIEEGGKSVTVPGIPLENSSGLYIASRKSTDERFIVDIKDENFKAVKSFYTQGSYDSLKGVYTDKKNQIHVQFEHVIESYSEETQKAISTKSSVIETYDASGKFLQENILESNDDVEIDQNLDIDDDGNLNNLVFQGDSFKVYELVI